MATATTGTTTVEHIDEALTSLAQIDLRTIKNPEWRNQIKTVRASLKDVRKNLKD